MAPKKLINIMDTVGSKENEENDSTTPRSSRGRSSTPRSFGSNILKSSDRFPHTNSPKQKSRKGGISNSNSTKQQLIDSSKILSSQHNHVHWQDDGDNIDDLQDILISPTSLDRNLEEQGIVGVYLHEKTGTSTRVQHQQRNNDIVMQQRTGLLQRRSASSTKDKDDNDDIRWDEGSYSPSLDRSTSCRIMRSSTFRAKYSAKTKRRMAVMAFAIGLAMVGYFFEVRQIMNTRSTYYGEYEASSSNTGWLVNLPRTFLGGSARTAGGEGGNAFSNDDGSMKTTTAGSRGEGFVEGYYSGSTPMVSIEEERKRVHALSKARAKNRRMRTKPPSTYPTIPVGAAAGADESTASSLSESNPPRLTLDLPAHRELDNPMIDHRTLQAVSDSSTEFNTHANLNIRRRLAENNNGQQPKSPPICGPHAREAAQLNPNHYPPSAHIGPKSRIVITGALSQVGMELILQLHEQCGVNSIVGIDAAYPNTRYGRIDMIESRYKYLQRRVPEFQRLIVPVFGLHPHPKMGEEIKFENMGQGFDIVSRLKPTHIVHLAGMEEGRGEYVDYGDTADASPFVEGGHSSMMRRFSSVLSIDQVLSSLATNGAAMGVQPQLVYISSNEANDQSGVSMKSGDKPIPASVYGTSCLLNEVLASHYHRHHGVDSVGLRVPTVFGPFARPGSLLYDLAERTVRNAAGKNVPGLPKYHLDRDRYELPNIMSRRDGTTVPEQFAFVYDIASAVLAAMQFKKDYSNPSIDPSGPTLIRIGSKLTTSMKDVNERMENYLPPADQGGATAKVSVAAESNDSAISSRGLSIYDTERNRDLLGWYHKTMLHEGFKSALAWQILRAYPYGLPRSVPAYSTFQTLLEDSRDSLSYHSLPCASGCRWSGTMCSSSPWDAVIDITHQITATCPYVLYTVDLRPELAGMEKQSAPSQRKGWEDMFCKIAFVSLESVLVQSVYGNSVKEREMKEWNGKSKAGSWRVVALEGSRYDMPEFERSLAKLTPTNLLNKRVEKAMYVNHRKVILTTDQAMGVMRHMEMPARKSRTKTTIVDEKTGDNVDIYLPPQPARHSVFFTNKYSFAEDFDTSSARNLAKFVMSNSGIAETKDIRAQLQFYEQSGHLTRTNIGRSPNYQEFFQDNFFPFDFLGSSWLVHELKSEEGRNLRCEMYEEHSLWGNSDMEDMSMGFVLAKRKVKMELGKSADIHYDGPEEWYPLLVPREPDDEDVLTEGPVYLDYLEAAQKVTADNKGHEFFVTFLPRTKN